MHQQATWSPVETLRLLDAKQINTRDVVTWAEQLILANQDLGQDLSIQAIAWMSRRKPESDEICAAIEDVIVRNNFLVITEDDRSRSRVIASQLLSSGGVGSITRQNCMDFLLGCYPEMASRLDERRLFFRGHEPGLFNELSAFIDCIVVSVAEHDQGSLSRCCRCIESLLMLGDAEVKNAAAVGIIEGVVNRCLNEHLPIDDFVNVLELRSREAYQALEEFWKNKRKEKEEDRVRRRKPEEGSG